MQQPFGKKKQLPYCSKSSCTGGWKASSWHLKDGDSSLTFVGTKSRRGFSSAVVLGAEVWVQEQDTRHSSPSPGSLAQPCTLPRLGDAEQGNHRLARSQSWL